MPLSWYYDPIDMGMGKTKELSVDVLQKIGNFKNFLQWDWQVSRAGPMLLYWPKLLYPYYSLLLFFPYSSFFLQVGIVGLGSSD